jgi:hypothetical protein
VLKQYAMKAYGAMEVQLHGFLMWALEEEEEGG